MLAYMIILSIAVAGMVHAHWWAAVAGGCLLALLTIVDRRGLALPGSIAAEPATVAAYAFINGSVAAGVAFALGRASGWLWGL